MAGSKALVASSSLTICCTMGCTLAADGRRSFAVLPHHPARDAAQDVDLLLFQLGAREQALQARHQLARVAGVEKADPHQRLLQVLIHALDLRQAGGLAVKAD